MFPGGFSGIAHRPGNPYGRRVWDAVVLNPLPPPTLQDGSSPARPQLIGSSDDDDDEKLGDENDEDLQIDEARSTPASANRQTNRAGLRQEHVSPQVPVEAQGSGQEVGRETGPSSIAERSYFAPVVGEQSAPLIDLSTVQHQAAQGVKHLWRVFPWEVTTRNPPQFDGNLAQGFCDLALAGCSLGRAKQLVEDQIDKRVAASPESPNHLVLDDVLNASASFVDKRVEKANNPAPAFREQSSRGNSTVGAHLPSPLRHTSALSPSGSFPPSAEESHSRPLRPSTPGTERFVLPTHHEPGLSMLTNRTQHSLADNQPRTETPQPSQQLAEQPGGTNTTRPERCDREAQPEPNPDPVPKPGVVMATIVELVDAPQSDPTSDSPRVGVGTRDVTSDAQQVLEDTITYSITELESLLRGRLKEIQEDREYFTKLRLGRARKAHHLPDDSQTGDSATDFISGPSLVPTQFQQQAFPWPNAEPIQTRGPIKPGGPKVMVQKTQEVFPQGSKGVRSVMNNPVNSYATDAKPVPPYTSYVSLKQNVLAENRRTLMIYPYFDDYQDEDVSKKSLWDELRSRYNIVADELRRRRLLQAEQSWQLRSYAEKFLQDFGCPMKDILRYFLLPTSELIQTLTSELQPHEAKYLQERREESCKEEFDRERKRWRKVLNGLEESLPAKIAFAAVFCPAWLTVFGFSFWHIARRTSAAQQPAIKTSSQPESNRKSSEFAYRDLACRVCHVHNCPFHGAILEQPDLSDHSDSDEETESEAESFQHITKDPSDSKSRTSRRSSVSSVDSLVNYKRLVNAQPRKHTGDDEAVQPIRRDAKYWGTRSKTHIMEKRPPFFPCSHRGSCSDAKCSCFKNGVTCEKTCACAASCKRRYRGCICAQEGLICKENKKCDCWNLNRECDPDLCASCGASEVLDPVNRHNDAAIRGKCTNVNIQRNVPKRTLLGESEVQGFGLYMGEKVNHGDYIGEYKGEIVMKEEGSRRGAVYQHLKTNYLFDLNRAQEVDSTRAGNKLRFINNSAKSPNCMPKVLLCNTVVRIGMFAIKDIKAGEELFFNYNYPIDVTKHFWEKGETKPSGTAYAVKSKKGVKQKARIADSELSSDSEISMGKARKAGPRQKAMAGRSRLGQSAVKGSSTINRLTWATSGKRPRQGVSEKQKTWAELNEYLDDGDAVERDDSDESEVELEDEESSEDGLEEYSESSEETRPRKKGRTKRF
ncbi:hypothetical protein MPH_01398 [Macrophomina phaseolina MS6]|uniref:SET domain-containing protein n=1 Tax=Macrophomina phaseolina (strain MS6) TaxID=1126212 RepID=K2SXG4_MACPH|nr:hypothetical protein MPH_01398 [Macrophomina phaseolina MS6]